MRGRRVGHRLATMATTPRLQRPHVEAGLALIAIAVCVMVVAWWPLAAAGQPEPATRSIVRRPGWTAQQAIASPHAIQAAVVSTSHAYAISNTTVAQYDRSSGRLMATGTAVDALHLNSGFFFDGKIYCAHSNYPAEPPESDIRVFDPTTGQLSLVHRFQNPPGSLVWCVQRNGNWWCCFAWYRAENARTVVIEFAESDFVHELRRFTFPESVVADWDGMSASGGIWDGDTLLVSHHHFPVLYRLAVPDTGTELEFVEALTCPFPGQGIAADPLTGGLVGIDRAARRIIFAERERDPTISLPCRPTPRSDRPRGRRLHRPREAASGAAT